ncbi:hypothetical protein [Kiloniella sp.]|uniref:hypothetical protein n=1 Tax=Kiloniella sp. TaxID=1938587 RepID=UPI003B021BF5
MSILLKEALTVAGIISLGMLVCIGTLIITGRFNTLLLRDRKFWNLICGDRKDGPAIVLAVVSAVLIINGFIAESPWLLGAGLVFIGFCYFKYRETLKKDPFEHNED